MYKVHLWLCMLHVKCLAICSVVVKWDYSTWLTWPIKYVRTCTNWSSANNSESLVYSLINCNHFPCKICCVWMKDVCIFLVFCVELFQEACLYSCRDSFSWQGGASPGHCCSKAVQHSGGSLHGKGTQRGELSIIDTDEEFHSSLTPSLTAVGLLMVSLNNIRQHIYGHCIGVCCYRGSAGVKAVIILCNDSLVWESL